MTIIREEGKRPKLSETYRIGGHTFKIISLFKKIHNMCEAYVCEEEAEYIIEITDEDIVQEDRKAMEEDALEGLPKIRYMRPVLETTAVYRKITDKLIEHGIFLFHGSVIAVDNEAYLFTAKSGTGKSTHTALWRELFGERAVMVNDDKPLLELCDVGVIVHGTPWNGKHNLGTKISVPLKALCVLERGEKNQIERLDASLAYPMALQQCNRALNAEKMIKTLELLEQMLHRVPVFRLKCNMDPEAAKVAYEGMQ